MTDDKSTVSGCPFCEPRSDGTRCPHLLASVDDTFREVCGGAAYDLLSEHLQDFHLDEDEGAFEHEFDKVVDACGELAISTRHETDGGPGQTSAELRFWVENVGNGMEALRRRIGSL